jgi:hypothetical protein
MAITLEDLERRVAALEQEMAAMRQRLEPPPISAGPPDYGSQMIREARALQPILDALTAKVFAEMGIPETPPVSIEELRRMMIESGVKPDENIFSREIIAMREE